MSVTDYLAQCGFWQWVGTIVLVAFAADGLARIIAAFFRRDR